MYRAKDAAREAQKASKRKRKVYYDLKEAVEAERVADQADRVAEQATRDAEQATRDAAKAALDAQPLSDVIRAALKKVSGPLPPAIKLVTDL